ncbi:Protein Red, partial [Ophiophagus hannah]
MGGNDGNDDDFHSTRWLKLETHQLRVVLSGFFHGAGEGGINLVVPSKSRGGRERGNEGRREGEKERKKEREGEQEGMKERGGERNWREREREGGRRRE